MHGFTLADLAARGTLSLGPKTPEQERRFGRTMPLPLEGTINAVIAAATVDADEAAGRIDASTAAHARFQHLEAALSSLTLAVQDARKALGRDPETGDRVRRRA